MKNDFFGSYSISVRKMIYMLFVIITVNSYSQNNVGIGTTSPDPSAKLEINSSSQGFLPPRVDLTSSTMKLHSPDENAVGLFVYNTGATLFKGYYFWDGIEWRGLGSFSSAPSEIYEVICASSSMSPSTYTAGTPLNGYILTVPYAGGNGARYGSVTINGTNGLTITLQPGSLEYGNGAFTFIVSGTPIASSPITANFTITTADLATAGIAVNAGSPFVSCDISVGSSSSNADIKTVAVLGPLTYTTEGRNGYSQVINTADGNFSVRCFIYEGANFNDVNLQIRNNSASDVDIIASQNWMWAGAGGTTNNQMRLAAGEWVGYNGSSSALVTATVQTPSNVVSWGDPGVYAGGMPEYRLYAWTSNDINNKTFYELRFMMGATTPGDIANATSCPGGTCTATKVFFYIREIVAQ